MCPPLDFAYNKKASPVREMLSIIIVDPVHGVTYSND
jgi:hypothetical protein